MSAESPTKLVERLTAVSEPELADFEQALGGEAEAGKKNPNWQMFDFELEQGAFERADLRLVTNGQRVRLILWTPEDSALAEGELELAGWGEPRSITVNPDIPPEGTMTYFFDVNDVKVSVQLTRDSRRLRSMILEWGADW